MGIWDKIFNASNVKWSKVFDSLEEANSKVPLNKAVTVLVEDQKVCLARTGEGFFAVADACPHLGASLSRGNCNNFNEVVCPWHSFRFNLKSGEETTGQNLTVRCYHTDIRKDGLYIGI